MKRRAIGDYARSAQPRSTLDMRHWWVQVGEESPKHAQPATSDLRLRDQASHGCRVRLWNLTTRNPPSNFRAPSVWDRKCPVPVREPGAHACRRPDRTDGTGASMLEAEPGSYCRVVNTAVIAVTRICRLASSRSTGSCPHRRDGDPEGRPRSLSMGRWVSARRVSCSPDMCAGISLRTLVPGVVAVRAADMRGLVFRDRTQDRKAGN